jgi:hypothetical protein
MIWQQSGRIFTGTGRVMMDATKLKPYLGQLGYERQLHPAREGSFAINRDGQLEFRLQNDTLLFTDNGLRTLAQFLKLPFQFLNTSSESHLVLNLLNDSQLREKNQWVLHLLTNPDTRQTLISGFTGSERPGKEAFFDVVAATNYQRWGMKIAAVAVGDRFLAIYLLSETKSTWPGSEPFDYRHGIEILYSENCSFGLRLRPYFEVSGGEGTAAFEFDKTLSDNLLQIPLKNNDLVEQFSAFMHDLTSPIDALGLEQLDHLVRAMRSANEVPYKLLKKIHSAMLRVFSASGLTADKKALSQEILPEYAAFRAERKDQLKEMKAFMANNIMAPIDLPGALDRLYRHPMVVESADAFILSKQKIFKILEELAETVNIEQIQ